jgi:hypothetical protein
MDFEIWGVVLNSPAPAHSAPEDLGLIDSWKDHIAKIFRFGIA